MAQKKYVYAFGGGKAEGKAAMRELLGGKGAGLHEMTRIGAPVPPGFTITTEVCTYYYDHRRQYPKGLETEIAQALARVEISSAKNSATRKILCSSPSAPVPASRCPA